MSRGRFRYGLACVAVTSKGNPVGIVTRCDLLRAAPSIATSLSVCEHHYVLGRVTAAEIMDRHPVTVAADSPLADAIQVMIEREQSAALVLDRGKLVGTLSGVDVMLALVGLLRTGGAPAPAVTACARR